MKPYLYTLLAAAAATGLAQAQTAYTTPVGYTTSTLATGKYNLIGLTLHASTSNAGVLDASQSVTNALLDTGADYSGIVSGSTYAVELDNGLVFEVPGTSFDDGADTINVGVDTSGYGGLAYSVRALKSIADAFGAANEAGLLPGASATTADTILVPTGSGFDEYFYSSGGFFGVGWRKTGSASADQSSVPLSYIDGFYVLRRGLTDLPLVVSGEVKTVDTNLPVISGFNLFGTIYPAGVTLGTSSLELSLQQGSSATVADTVLVPTASGFDEYYYSNGGFFGVGWRKTGAASADQSGVVLPSGVIIKRLGADVNALLTPPPSYDSL